MPADVIRFPARLGDRPLYAFLVQFPAVCFVATFVADIAYWRTASFMWETFSAWLVAAGCVMAALAGLVGLFEFLRDRRIRSARFAWPHALLSLLAVVLSVVNAFVHSRDGYTAVVPDGLTLSGIVVLLMLAVTWLGWTAPTAVERTGVAA